MPGFEIVTRLEPTSPNYRLKYLNGSIPFTAFEASRYTRKVRPWFGATIGRPGGQ
jgi:hypothetical protein